MCFGNLGSKLFKLNVTFTQRHVPKDYESLLNGKFSLQSYLKRSCHFVLIKVNPWRLYILNSALPWSLHYMCRFPACLPSDTVLTTLSSAASAEKRVLKIFPSARQPPFSSGWPMGDTGRMLWKVRREYMPIVYFLSSLPWSGFQALTSYTSHHQLLLSF